MSTPKRLLKQEQQRHVAAMGEYRSWLIASEQKSQEAFDKAVLALSGGALGISFVFLEHVVGDSQIQSHQRLLCAWISWGLSVTLTLASFYVSHLALRSAIRQVDDGSIHQKPAGGLWAQATELLNAGGAALFFVGVCFMTAFAHANFAQPGADHGIKAPVVAPTADHPADAKLSEQGVHSTTSAASTATATAAAE